MKTMRKMIPPATALRAVAPPPYEEYRGHDWGIDPVVAEHVRLCRARERLEECRHALYAQEDAGMSAEADAQHPDASNLDAWYNRY